MKYLHPKKWKRLTREFLINFWNLYILPDEYYLKKQYYKSCGEKLNLKNPQKLTEKIQWLKLYDRNPDYHLLVDKYEVRKHQKFFNNRPHRPRQIHPCRQAFGALRCGGQP